MRRCTVDPRRCSRAERPRTRCAGTPRSPTLAAYARSVARPGRTPPRTRRPATRTDGRTALPSQRRAAAEPGRPPQESESVATPVDGSKRRARRSRSARGAGPREVRRKGHISTRPRPTTRPTTRPTASHHAGCGDPDRRAIGVRRSRIGPRTPFPDRRLEPPAGTRNLVDGGSVAVAQRRWSGMCPSRGSVGTSTGTVSGYFSPVPVLSTTTSSRSDSQPPSRSCLAAAMQAAPSGQMKVLRVRPGPRPRRAAPRR